MPKTADQPAPPDQPARAPADGEQADPPADDEAVVHTRMGLLYQLLETELGGVQVYRTALQCALEPELKREWARYLAQTERHVVIARDLLERLGLDPDAELPARLLCRHDAEGLVRLMLEALAIGTPEDAQLCAAECVVKAETKDHLNWSLLGHLAKGGAGADAMRTAYADVEREEDHHLYHSKGWARELWAKGLGLPAALPPPEERRDVESAMEAALAEEARDEVATQEPSS